MYRISKYIYICFAMIFSPAIMEADESKITKKPAVSVKLPKELVFNNKPIEAVCMPDLENESESVISLKTCKRPALIIQSAKSEGDETFIGYRYKYKGASKYRAYYYVGVYNGRNVIIERSDDGGSSRGSELLFIERKSSLLLTHSLFHGDECRFVIKADINNNSIFYSCSLWLSNAAEETGLVSANIKLLNFLRRLDSPRNIVVGDYKNGALQIVHLEEPNIPNGMTIPCDSKIYYKFKEKNLTTIDSKNFQLYLNDVYKVCN